MISLASPSAASLINATNGVVILRNTSAGHKEVSLLSPLESQNRSYRSYHRLWRSRLTTAARQEIALTAVFPLEFNLLIFGYSMFSVRCQLLLTSVFLGDGHLRRTSFPALTSPKSPSGSPPSSFPTEVPLFQNVSNIAIPASICSLHLIRNERTGDRFIIGGSDDGGVTIWSLQYEEIHL